MIKVTNDIITTDGNIVDLMTEFIVLVCWLRNWEGLSENAIKTLVDTGLEKASFEKLEMR